jgi:hypothetical protein
MRVFWRWPNQERKGKKKMTTNGNGTLATPNHSPAVDAMHRVRAILKVYDAQLLQVPEPDGPAYNVALRNPR